ncbi:hypothetical protein KC19_8G038900 [Ceratodon purpureus]|uniref:AAA+ ATPase domain-containing protein n=1 Tax=Ceratodon purpureus TaxID=3225 RepID=A0A8T0GXA8_CERPU|nr:hypothetical protein KC19_8G038900 [Ceratodon purpureus]
MYRRCVKPWTGRLHEFYSRDPFDSCQSMIRGVSASSVAEVFASQGRLYSRFARGTPKEVTMGTGAWRLNRGFWRLAQFQRREFTTASPHSWFSCSEDCTPGIPSAAFLLRHQRLLSGYAFRPARQGLISQREGLSRASPAFTRSFSDERGSDDKDQAAVSSAVGSGGDNDKGAEHVLACDSGSEEDEKDEGQRRRHPAVDCMGQDERSREGEQSHRGSHKALFLAQKARYKKVFEERLVRWEDLKVTLEEFPHYLSGTTRDLLVDCAAAHLRQPSYAEFGSGLLSSSRRICLRGPAGTQLHQERLVEALAHHLRVPLLVLNSTTLAPHDFGAHELFSASNFDGSDSESESTSTFNDEEKLESRSARLRGARGFKVDVLLDMTADSVEAKRLLKVKQALGVETEQEQGNPAVWEASKVADLSPDNSPAADPCEEWVAAIDALCEMSLPSRPLVVYFPDPRQWFERAVALDRRQEFLERVEAKLDQIEGPVVLISSRTSDEEAEVDDRARLKAHLEDIRARLNQRTSTRWVFRELLGSEDIYELFPNHVIIYPPKEEGMLREWKKQLLSNKEISSAKHNIQQLREVLETNNMDCEELQALNLLGLNLSKTKAEKVVGWARNHHLGLCLFDPPTSNGKLMIPRDSMERALTRLRDQENKKAPSIIKDFKTVAEDEYEKALISAVIPPNEVGVKFDHIGALENVKSALKELVMLPLQRPELFSKGNLTRPCKGVLLFGPPGTGKTLLAKAVATEAGANFINITGSTITSKWFGDAEKLTKSLFSLARKLSPAVIFVDEVDSLLGARGGSSEHEATRKTRNEFMAAWDGLRSKDSERVLVLAATNRPFDLDDAVIRRLPRRILVDLPNTENRVKILRVILAEEELEEGFDYEELSRITDGYSGSDLKNLSIAAAYRPIRELLQYEEQEAKVGGGGGGTAAANRVRSAALIRPLRFEDFKQAMTQVGASVAFDASSMNELRRWNEQYGEGGNRRKSNFGFVV